ncbi:MAG: hypothetical protein J7M29_13020 [Verrucomicrobia bacterium]|nr:hypothetical protein [Verrucomicrobiota bacterium]
MIQESEKPSRREFFRTAGRWVGLGGLLALGGAALARGTCRLGGAGAACSECALARGCPLARRAAAAGERAKPEGER